MATPLSYNDIVQQGLKSNNYTVDGESVVFNQITFKNVSNPKDSMNPFKKFCYGYKCRDGVFGTADTLENLQNQQIFIPEQQQAYGGKRNKSNKSKTPKRGGSVLAKLAAPGVLLVASELYKRRQSRTSKNKSRKFRKTRKYGRK